MRQRIGQSFFQGLNFICRSLNCLTLVLRYLDQIQVSNKDDKVCLGSRMGFFFMASSNVLGHRISVTENNLTHYLSRPIP